MNKCSFCKKETLRGHNYCDFNCHISAAKADGYIEIRPNGLPIKCITGDGKLLEHEHGDHPNYIKPIKVLINGYRYNHKTNEEQIGPEFSDTEIHALIFYDGKAAVTLYETIYCFWVNGKIRSARIGEDFYKKYNAELIFE